MIGKKKILFISALSVAVLIVLAVAFLLIREIRNLSGAKEGLKKLISTWETYYKKNPFPSKENIAIERGNEDLLKNKYEELITKLKKGEMPLTKDKRPTLFMTALGNGRIKMVKLASENGVTLPAEFSFGFEHFLKDGIPPAPADVPRLTQQLAIIESFCNILFEEKIKEIKNVRREVFEDVARISREQTVQPEKVEDETPKEPKKVILSRQHFSYEFSAKESSLLRILNRFANHEMISVVTSVTISSTKEDLMDAPILSASSKGTDASSDPWRDRIVCGIETEKPMDVEIGIDVYTFKGKEKIDKL